MPSYAVLGGTGNTGLSLLTILSTSPEIQINVYVRSRAKLLRLRPEVASNQNITVYEGDMHEVPLIRACIAGTRAVFAVVAAGDNAPGTSIARESAHVIVSTMDELRTQDSSAPLPRVVFLSSASLSPHLCQNIPGFVQWLLHTACSNVYADLAAAEAYLRTQQSWMNVTFIQPGGLVHDAQKGHVLSVERQKTFLSFLDLAAGMVEVADTEGEQFDWVGVSVLPTAKDVKTEWMVPVTLMKGILVHFFPWMYRFLK
ncbi:hypothetical protein B0A49_01072 [Cryomyces minteri]|uniref:NAD(P)-binding domain-containing protein n=1 Tax=Cryomyces minteri TaxID=331657 RepID=A0A4U0XVF3_9PEZI|nr:hypothetical protein B0A49_01072 [Cryomyces minteri]